MKKLLLMAIATVALSFTASALEPVGIVFPYTGETAEITCELVDYGAEDGIEPIFTQEIGELTPNSSGILYFQLGKDNENWTEIASSSVSSYYVVNVKVGEDIKAQFRLDELIKLSARSSTGGTTTLTDGEFIDAEGFSSLTTNIMVYTGNEPEVDGERILQLNSGQFGDGLPTNAQIIIVNNTEGSTAIDFGIPDFDTKRIVRREYIIIMKVGNQYFLPPFDTNID